MEGLPEPQSCLGLPQDRGASRSLCAWIRPARACLHRRRCCRHRRPCSPAAHSTDSEQTGLTGGWACGPLQRRAGESAFPIEARPLWASLCKAAAKPCRGMGSARKPGHTWKLAGCRGHRLPAVGVQLPRVAESGRPGLRRSLLVRRAQAPLPQPLPVQVLQWLWMQLELQQGSPLTPQCEAAWLLGAQGCPGGEGHPVPTAHL